MNPTPITYDKIFRVLVIGFSAVIVLLITAGFIGANSAHLIQESAAAMVRNELVTTRLIEELQREQDTLNATFYKLSRAPDLVDRERVLSQLDEADGAIERIVQEAAGTPDEQLWSELRAATHGFSKESRRLLSLQDVSSLSSRDLFRRHEDVTSIVAKLIGSGYDRALAAQTHIEHRSNRLVRGSFLLLGACLALALICAILTVRITTELFRKMEWQTSELSRVTWHMLESQETTARRFSHELHDELGQSLTAVKTNLLALQSGKNSARERMQDCMQLVDEAIQNVRELSQLLRPTILDDFGLDASLRWLSERFTQRTGIEVEYQSNFQDRLADETETHVFRIVQEALTNVARHSGATRVRIQLQRAGERIHLTLEDNGRGLKSAQAASRGAKRMSNSADSAAAGESVVREFDKGAQAAGRGAKRMSNSADSAAAGESVVRELDKGAQAAGRGAKVISDSADMPAAGESVVREVDKGVSGTGAASMGLIGMRARARSAGGELTVKSRDGAGLCIELWAPVRNTTTR